MRNPRADHNWRAPIAQRERFSDFAHTLARVDWDLFTTFTFTNPLPKPYVRGAMVWKWFRTVSEIGEVPYKNMLIALRREHGEIGGRPHFHGLIGGLTSCNMASLKSQMIRAWKTIANNGHLDCRRYDRSLAGADYICKCLGANAYELSKFTIADETTLSESVISLARVLAAKSDRRCCEVARKERQVARVNGAIDVNGRMGCIASPVAGSIKDITVSAVAGGLDHPAPRMQHHRP